MPKRKMPTELNAEIVAALPFDIRWANVRISFAFDHFLYKKQAQWIRNELIRQKIVEENRQRLGQAKRRIEAMSFRLFENRLRNLRDLIASHFRLDNCFGLTENQFRGELTPEIFEIQLDAIFETIDRNNLQDISWAQKFIQSLADGYEGYVDEYVQANQ